MFKCGDKDCRKQFTAKVGTIFTDTHIPLKTWFYAIYLLTSHKKGVSSVQMGKHLQITQKSAWFMLQRIRYAMNYGLDKPFEKVSEVDETYIGPRTTRDLMFTKKSVVLGIVEKEKGSGHIVTRVTTQANATTAINFIRENVKPNSTIHTDESHIYNRLSREYNHDVVIHTKKEYVRDGVSTNTIDGAWNHLKLGLKAIYMGVSPKHLSRYCDEFGFRYNTRDLEDGERFTAWFTSVNGKHLTYKRLVS